MLCKKLQTAVMWITDREKGGVFHPGESCTNTVEPVLEMLWEKHPEDRAPFVRSLDDYSHRSPEMIHLDLTEDTVM